MFKKLIDRARSAATRTMASKGLLVCPTCGEKSTTANGDLVTCLACGTRASMEEWTARVAPPAIAAADPDSPPLGTRISRAIDPSGKVVWMIPASGKSGGLMVFACLWCAVTAMISGGFLIVYLSGKPLGGNLPGWALIPFFGLFWVVGLGVFYAAIRSKYATHRLSAGPDQVILRRECFGRSSEKSLVAADVRSVSQTVFYTQNYEPVHGIEIRGKAGRLRFGSMLTESEKSWLTADLNRVIIGAPSPTATPAAVTAARQSYFSIVLPRGRGHLLSLAIVLSLMGVCFLGVGVFVIDHTPITGSEGAARIFDLVFHLFTEGFRGIWLLMSGLMTASGITLLFFHLRSRRRETRLEGTDSEISIRVYQHGRVLRDRTFPRPSVTDLSSSVSGSSNGKPMKRIELITADSAEKLAWWIDADLADAFVTEARAALG
jgi:hypothetical protein